MSTNLIVNRNGVTYHLDVENTSAILDTDYILVNRDGVTYKAPGDTISKGTSSGPLGSALPPFTSESGPAMNLSNVDGKVEFSLDGNSWSTSLSIPSETIYYCIWGSDILSAAHNSSYEALISVNYPNLSMDQDVEIKLKIDKLPDPFTLDTRTDVVGLDTYVSNTISPLGTINAPTAIWGSSNATTPQIAIADGPWESLPTTINTRYVNMNERVRVRHTAGAGAATDYFTVLNIGYGTGADEFETSTFSTTTASVVFNPGTLTSDFTPVTNRRKAPFTLSAPTGQNVNHVATTWQLSTTADFSVITEESVNNSSDLLTHTFTQMEDQTAYYARAQYIDASGVVSTFNVAAPVTGVVLGTVIELPAPSAQEINEDSAAVTGEYYISTPGGIRLLKCDMDTNGGGWTLFARNNQSDDYQFNMSSDFGFTSLSPAARFVGVSYKDSRDNVSNTNECEYLISMNDGAYQIKASTLYSKGSNNYNNRSFTYYNGASTLNNYITASAASSLVVGGFGGGYPGGQPAYQRGDVGQPCKETQFSYNFSSLGMSTYTFRTSGGGSRCSDHCGGPGTNTVDYSIVPTMSKRVACFADINDISMVISINKIEVFFREKT